MVPTLSGANSPFTTVEWLKLEYKKGASTVEEVSDWPRST